MDLVEQVDRLLVEAKKYDDLPTVMEYINAGIYGRKKRTRPARKALASFWLEGSGNDVPRRIVTQAGRAVTAVESDMAAEWKADGYSDERIANAAFETAREIHPELEPGFFWLNLLDRVHKTSGPAWKVMPDRF